MPGALFGRPCWRGLPPARPRPRGLGRLQQQHWRAIITLQFPKAAAASSSDSGGRDEQPPHLAPSPRLEQRQQEWQARLLQVTAFQQQHGWVPRQRPSSRRPLVEGEAELGRWCGQQRRRRDGSWGEPLSAEETAALQAIPSWNWEGRQQQQQRRSFVRMPWEERRQQVAAFIQQYNRLPRVDASKAEPFLEGEQQLGWWCHRQRQRYKGQGTRAPLTAGQVAALEALPGWFWEQYQVQPWEQWLEQVAAFLAQHGRLPRTDAGRAQPLLEGEQQLGEWCNRQRQRRKGTGNGGTLAKEQVAALEALPGWFWEERQVEPWEQRLQQVAAFVEQHGRLPRRKGSKAEPLVEGEQRLCDWCQLQRQRYKGKGNSGPLTPEQVVVLEALPGWVWKRYEKH